MLYNVLQVCHGGHSLCVFYVRVGALTNREQKDAKKCRLGAGGGEGLGKRKETVQQVHRLSIYPAATGG